jgi:exodeoxyribonuclease VII large subunit
VGPSTSASTEDADLTVLELNRRVSSLLDTAFPYPVWVRGEVAGNPRSGRRGHTYFQLVEPSTDGGFPEASIDCALFAGSRNTVVREFARLGETFRLEAGMSIRALGRVNLWPEGGRYQFIVQSIDAAWSRGTQALRLKKLAARLRREGVLQANSVHSLPGLPLEMGLVTAADSAACRDFLRTLEESGYPFSVRTAWAAMQGRETGETVSRAIARLGRLGGLDVIVLTRGGGSTTDLGWMNDESIARAIADSPVPVVSGIGHEVDTTLPDLAASVRAKTPTHAATLLVDCVAGFESDLDSLSRMLGSHARPALRAASMRLRDRAGNLRKSVRARTGRESALVDSASAGLAREAHRLLRLRHRELAAPRRSLGRARIPERLARRRGRVSEAARALSRGAEALLRTAGLRLERMRAAAESRDPERVLALGWAVARHADGRIIRSVGEVSPGDGIDVRLRDGSLSATADEVRPDRKR